MNKDFLLREKYLTPSAAALGLALALGAVACGGKSTCLSNYRVSRQFPLNSEATSDRNTWSRGNGIEIENIIPDGAEEVDVGFTDPGGYWHGEWLPSDKSQIIGMEIGDAAVRFRVRIKADKGSVVCGEVPKAGFLEKPYSQIKQEATIPDPSKFRPEP